MKILYLDQQLHLLKSSSTPPLEVNVTLENIELADPSNLTRLPVAISADGKNTILKVPYV